MTNLKLVVALLAILGVVLLGVDFKVMERFDHATLALFAKIQTPLADTFFGTITWLGSFYLLAPLAVFLCCWWLFQGQWTRAMLLSVGLFGAALATKVAKLFYKINRPLLYESPLASQPVDFAYPSGHVTQVTATALCLLLMLPLETTRGRLMAVALMCVTVLVAVSRMYLQVHWPTDVLGGALVALIWVSLSSVLTDEVRLLSNQHEK